MTRAVKNASLNEKRRKRGDPLVMDIVDESQDAEERERTYDELKRKIDRELTSTQKYILEEKEYGGRTYRAHGSSFSKVDRISVNSSSRDCSVRMRFFCQNGDLRHADSSYFVAEWVRTIPFEEGLQTVLVALPMTRLFLF